MSGLVLKIGDPASSVFRNLNQPKITPEPCLAICLAEQAGT